MIRYDVIEGKRPREILLLKGRPCAWGKCAFCDYIEDNADDENIINSVNYAELRRVTGIYKALEVINSGSVFELTDETLSGIKKITAKKNISSLYFESSYMYKNKLNEIRDYFGCNVIFKCGIETFDDCFRNKILKKGINLRYPEEAAEYFDSVCLLVGVKGQTKEMIDRDIDILLKSYKLGCINIFQENSTAIKADAKLIEWFKEKYSFLNDYNNIDVLWNNTDFGVGGINK